MTLRNLVLDCDGIILDFIIGFNDWYEQLNYPSRYGLISRDPQGWNFDWTGDSHLISQLIADFIATRPTLPLIFKNWPTVMKHWKSLGYQILIVSHYSDWDGRVQNLKDVGLELGSHYDSLYCMKDPDSKVQKILELKPSYYLEDTPHIVKHLLQFTIDWPLIICVPLTYRYSNQLPSVFEMNNLTILRYTHPEELPIKPHLLF